MPGFGKSPPTLAGREDYINSIRESIRRGPRDHRFVSLLVAPRGYGKTVILTSLRERLSEDGWVTLDAVGAKNCLENIAVQAVQGIYSLKRFRALRRIRGVGVSALGFGATVLSSGEDALSTHLRIPLEALATACAKRGKGVLLTVDEMMSLDPADLRQVATVLQTVSHQAELPLGFVGAGLPHLLDDISKDDKITFFQRCERHRLPLLNLEDVVLGLDTPIRAAGGSIDSDTLLEAAEHCGGYPYKMQKLGHTLWALSDPDGHRISRDHLAPALKATETHMRELVYGSVWDSLSAGDREVVAAMLLDGGSDSRVTQIARRLNRTAAYVGVYRKRLAALGVVEPGGRGRMRLTGFVPREEMATRLEAERSLRTPPASAAPVVPAYGFFMPRAKSPCVLTKGHKGPHRSRV